MVLRFQPGRLMTPVMFLLGLMLVSYWLNPGVWQHLGLMTKAVFAFVFLAFAGLMVTMRNRIYLRMDERGLEIKYAVGAPRFYAWADIESARVIKKRVLLVPVMSAVGLRLRHRVRPESALRRAAGSSVGYEVTFLAVYEESAEEILEKIEMFTRER